MDIKCEHLVLLIDDKTGRMQKEPIHVEHLQNGNIKVLHSPGFIRGIAAGDEIKLIDRNGTFEVVRRGGNISVQVYSLDPIQKYTNKLCEKVEALNGTLDGSIDRGLVFTIPLSAGFSSIEKIFDEFVTSTPNTEWYYGNVYDPKDMETPLGWWLDLEKK